ncbi:hypothetical protein INF26_05790 [Olsenella sp. DSM 107455]|uniref:Uncharacterized protein n=1 Tax=Thermophilibacter gallinarum TaxID=2779357 RepID=A0ABR9QTF7_9ACTN|nr:hypothetical protein [Thermophilibacter gallinarum]MBE5024366.1 hypothetical protein [Thermophilibacter gallinarum]
MGELARGFDCLRFLVGPSASRERGELVENRRSNKPLLINLWPTQGTQQKIPVAEKNEEKKRKENKAKRAQNESETAKSNPNHIEKYQLNSM